MRNLLLGLLPLGLTLAGCTTAVRPTGYHPMAHSHDFGYMDERLREDVYRVSYRGTPATQPDAMRDYTLLRAAELTLAEGYTFFRLYAEGSAFAARFARAPVIHAPRWKQTEARSLAEPTDVRHFSYLIHCYRDRPRIMEGALYVAATERARLAAAYGLQGVSKLYLPLDCLVEPTPDGRSWTLMAGSSCDPRWGFAHGPGEAESNDGVLYKGGFWRGRHHGQGVMTWPDGRITEGEWRQGQHSDTP